MKLYDSLKMRKENGEKLNFEEINKNELKQMFIDEEISDKLLADLYDVKLSKISYKRKKYGITIRSSGLNKMLLGTTEESRKLNENCRENILKKENLDLIARAITHFAFRNGPVEDMHADPDSQLSEEDMKTLNIFMANRMAYIFELIIEERWFEFSVMINSNGMFGQDWNKAVPDNGGTLEEIEMMMKYYKKRS